jgi:hypothetical protein
MITIAVNPVEEEGFFVEALSEETTKEFTFVKSTYWELESMASVFRKKNAGAVNDLSNSRFPNVDIVLMKLISFVFDFPFDAEVDYLDLDKRLEPIKSRQKAVKECHLFELLMEIIHLPFSNGYFVLGDVHRIPYISKTLALAYVAIRVGIMECRPNELYVSQWIDVLMHYSLSELDGCIGANTTLTELMDNNQKLLECQIDRTFILKLVNNATGEEFNKKYLEMLRTLCICDGKPIAKNQLLISTLLLQDSVVRNKFLPKLLLKDDKVYITLPSNGQTVAIENFKSESRKVDKGRYYEFFVSVIRLLSDLSMNRNYLAIDQLKQYLTLELCTEVICSNACELDFRSAFVDLVVNLWVNSNPFMKIRFPNNIKRWELINRETNNSVDEMQARTELARFQKLKDQIMREMGRLRCESEAVWDDTVLDFQMSLLKVTREMVYLGFYAELAEFRQIYRDLVHLLELTDRLAAPAAQTAARDIRKVFDLKVALCNCLRIFKDFKVEQSANLLIAKYKENRDLADAELLSASKKTTGKLLGFMSPKLLGLVSGASSLKGGGKAAQMMVGSFDAIYRDTIADPTSLFNQGHLLALLLINQAMYKNQLLTDVAVELLYELYSQGKTLHQFMKGMQIIEEKKDKTSLEGCNEVSKQLFSLFERFNSNWFEDKRLNELEEANRLFSKMQTMLHGLIVSLNLEYRIFEVPEVYRKMFEANPNMKSHLRRIFENVDTFFQNLARNTFAIEYIVKLLYNRMENLRHLQEDPKSQEKFSIIEELFQILAVCVHSNSTNQKLMTDVVFRMLDNNIQNDEKYWPSFLVFLNEMLKSNTDILQDIDRVKRIIHVLIECMLRDREKPLRLAYYLTLLQPLVFEDDLTLKNNQNHLITPLLSSRLNPLFSKFKGSNIVDTIKAHIIDGDLPAILYNQTAVVVLEEAVCLTISYIEILSFCCFDANVFSEKLAQSLISLK